MTTRRVRTPEGAVQGPCLTLLALRGYPVLRVNSGALRDSEGRVLFLIRDHTNQPWRGVPDVLSVTPVGRFLCVEFKSVKGRLTADQARFLETVRGWGGVALVVRDLATLDRVLTRLAVEPWARFTIEGGDDD